ncbi:hypothetical protein FACS189421_00360 [Bacteroidia bacterium]|nr:hypothetical protein FACS189421_00360 [Bacteroidia bacterium]GHT47489.1 hypothetical protein FACS189440_08150 [Bacteroidia bacterium]
MMKKKLLLFLLLGFSIFSYSQERKIKISLQAGHFDIGNHFQNVVTDWNAGMDVSYFLSERFFLTAHFNSGQNRYYYDLAPLEIPPFVSKWEYTDGTNARMIMNNVGLLAGYCLPITHAVNLTGQIGFSQFIAITKNSPTIVYMPDESYADLYSTEDQLKRSLYFSGRDFAFFSASFPVKFSVGVAPFRKLNIGVAKNIEIGYAVGFYIEPDFGFFIGVYYGPQLSVSF